VARSSRRRETSHCDCEHGASAPSGRAAPVPRRTAKDTPLPRGPMARGHTDIAANGGRHLDIPHPASSPAAGALNSSRRFCSALNRHSSLLSSRPQDQRKQQQWRWRRRAGSGAAAPWACPACWRRRRAPAGCRSAPTPPPPAASPCPPSGCPASPAPPTSTAPPPGKLAAAASRSGVLCRFSDLTMPLIYPGTSASTPSASPPCRRTSSGSRSPRSTTAAGPCSPWYAAQLITC
jgi:hypothetical protein